jgi:hypothetical protein
LNQQLSQLHGMHPHSHPKHAKPISSPLLHPTHPRIKLLPFHTPALTAW